MINLTDQQKQELIKQMDEIYKNTTNEKGKALIEDFKNNLIDKMDENSWLCLAMITGMYAGTIFELVPDNKDLN